MLPRSDLGLDGFLAGSEGGKRLAVQVDFDFMVRRVLQGDTADHGFEGDIQGLASLSLDHLVVSKTGMNAFELDHSGQTRNFEKSLGIRFQDTAFGMDVRFHLDRFSGLVTDVDLDLGRGHHQRRCLVLGRPDLHLFAQDEGLFFVEPLDEARPQGLSRVFDDDARPDR